METLVAKSLEELGLFVPAYRGGNLKDVDLLAYNDTEKQISFANIILKRETSVQVKRKKGKMRCPPSCDLLVGIGVVGKCAVDGPMLLSQVLKLPRTRAWLKRSLNWIPEKYLTDVGL